MIWWDGKRMMKKWMTGWTRSGASWVILALTLVISLLPIAEHVEKHSTNIWKQRELSVWWKWGQSGLHILQQECKWDSRRDGDKKRATRKYPRRFVANLSQLGNAFSRFWFSHHSHEGSHSIYSHNPFSLASSPTGQCFLCMPIGLKRYP